MQPMVFLKEDFTDCFDKWLGFGMGVLGAKCSTLKSIKETFLYVGYLEIFLNRPHTFDFELSQQRKNSDSKKWYITKKKKKIKK